MHVCKLYVPLYLLYQVYTYLVCTFETWKGFAGAGAGKNKPDLLTGVLTPVRVQDQQLTRLWFGKTYTNSHTGQDRKRSILPNGSDFYFRNCTSEPICRNWLWEALDVG